MNIYTHTRLVVYVYINANTSSSALSISFSGFKQTQLTRQQPTTFCDDAGLPLLGHTTEELPEEPSETWMAKRQIQQHTFY